MKVIFRLVFFASLVACSDSADLQYGPANCVTLSRSLAGSCVMSTNCEAHIHELDKFEFVFDCESSKDRDIVRHSFGVGGFDANEEFDTEVKCDACAVPRPEHLEHKQQPTAQQAKHAPAPTLAKVAPTKAPRTYASLHNYEHIATGKAERPKTLVGMYRAKQAKELTAASKSAAAQVEKLQEATAKVAEEADEKEAEEEEVVETKSDSSKTARYGPNACVSTYRSKEGHCIMKTDCDGEDIKNYTFGLVCVDKVGAPVRHIFGKDSFDPEETFDTLISCEKCLGLDDIPESISLNSQVMQLTGAVAGLGDLLKNISKSVETLNEKVFADKKVEDKTGKDSEEDTKEEEKNGDDTEGETASKESGSDSDDSEQTDKEESGSDDATQADKEKAEEDKKAADAAEVAKEAAPAAKEEAPAAEEEEAPAAKQDDDAAPAADDNSTGTDAAEEQPEEKKKEELPELVKLHGVRRTHKHTRRAARHHKHTRSGSLRHEVRVHAHHEARAHHEDHHEEVPVTRTVAPAPKRTPPAPRAQPAAVVEANAGVGMKEQTRRLRASVNAERQQAAAASTDDEDDSDDSQDEADGDNDDAQPHFENNMQQQGEAPVQTLESLDDAVQPVQMAVEPAEQMPAASYNEEQAQHEQEEEGSYQRFDNDDPAEDRNGFDSGEKFN